LREVLLQTCSNEEEFDVWSINGIYITIKPKETNTKYTARRCYSFLERVKDE